MDDSFHDLESELKSLRPLRPSADLRARLLEDLAGAPGAAAGQRYTSATNLASWKWLGWRVAGLAALVALITSVSWLNLRAPTPQAIPLAPKADLAMSAGAPTAAAPRLPEVAATNVLYDMKDEGTLYMNGDRPLRKVRYRFVDTYTLKDPRTNASLKWSVPRDEIRVLPASLN